jgi:hypothetical protein
VRRSENKVGLNFISRRVPKPDWPEVVQI